MERGGRAAELLLTYVKDGAFDAAEVVFPHEADPSGHRLMNLHAYATFTL